MQLPQPKYVLEVLDHEDPHRTWVPMAAMPTSWLAHAYGVLTVLITIFAFTYRVVEASGGVHE